MTDNETYETEHPVVPNTAEIVVGIDESPAAADALRWAAEESRLRGLPLRVVHAWQLNASEAAAVAAGAIDFMEAASADARARATLWVLDALGGDAAGIRWQLEILEGSPGPVLVARSRSARNPTVVAVPTSERPSRVAGAGQAMFSSPGPLF